MFLVPTKLQFDSELNLIFSNSGLLASVKGTSCRGLIHGEAGTHLN